MTFIERCYKDTHGRITLFQTPNLPLIVWILCSSLHFLHVPFRIATGVSFTGTSFLIIWAWLEVTSGANYVRRMLGVVILLVTILPKFK